MRAKTPDYMKTYEVDVSGHGLNKAMAIHMHDIELKIKKAFIRGEMEVVKPLTVEESHGYHYAHSSYIFKDRRYLNEKMEKNIT